MSVRTAGMAVVCLAVGLGIGFAVGRNCGEVSQPVPSVPLPPPPVQPTETNDIQNLRAQVSRLDDENRVLRVRNQELKAEMTRLRDGFAQVAGKRPAPAPALALAPVPSVPASAPDAELPPFTGMHRAPFSLKRGLTVAEAKTLELSEPQAAAVRAALTSTREKVKAAEMAHATREAVSETETRITIRPFPEDAGRIREELQAGVRATVQDEGVAKKLEALLFNAESDLTGLGEGTREITISAKPAGGGGRPVYRITDRHVSGNAEPGALDAGENLVKMMTIRPDAQGETSLAGITHSISAIGSAGSTRVSVMESSVVPPEFAHWIETEQP